MDPDTLLVVAATRSEARYVPEAMPLLICGVGKTMAAVATAKALAAYDARALARLTVLNVGTAGALRDGLEGLHLPGTVRNHDISAAAIRALGFDPHEELSVAGGDETVLASGDVFVADPAVRESLARDAHLVDMEGYAIAWACREFGVPLRLVKHVSDNADHSAHGWADAVDESARALGDWLGTTTES